MAADDRLEDDELARRLREAHRRVRALTSADKARYARRYLAICDLAKRDPARAAARLEALLASLDGDFDTPRAAESTPGD
ncbi:hypothetical protein FHU36_008118 [Nonomuraea muscovyensis]|uniref:Uncharacterized protein n=1 Tax=Nonomuraea muscovyensis TaxID=1124761 RepID=A0A7X0CAE3_9ACTN|nr:hypothetical protein [Nonomuraea muscovyensis]MBB6351535.1 hypothetical protein [Nonomuraea muscovyensis]